MTFHVVLHSSSLKSDAVNSTCEN